MLTALSIWLPIVILLLALIFGVRPTVAFASVCAIYLFTGLLDYRTVIEQLASNSVITIAMLVVLTGGLANSRIVGAFLKRMLKTGSERFRLFKLTLVAGLFSGVLNNTAVVATLLPYLRSVDGTLRKRVSLISLSYCCMLGGVLTMVGSLTNLTVGGVYESVTGRSLGLFSPFPVGILAFAAGLGIMLTVSILIFKSETLSNTPDGKVTALGGTVTGGADTAAITDEQGTNSKSVLLMLKRSSKEVNSSFDPAVLSENLGGQVVCLTRAGEGRSIEKQQRLESGDVIELQVDDKLRNSNYLALNFYVLAGREHMQSRQKQNKYAEQFAFGGLLLAILANAFGLFPLTAGLLLATGLLLVVGVINAEELRQRLPISVLIILIFALSISTVLSSAESRELIIGSIEHFSSSDYPWVFLLVVYLLGLLLTEFMTNVAAAAMLAPIALAVSSAMTLDPTLVAMVVIFSTNAAFLLPSGHQTHLMVLNEGQYKTTDYIKFGFPILLAYTAVCWTTLPFFYGV